MKRVILPLSVLTAFSFSVAGFATAKPSQPLSTQVAELATKTQALQAEVTDLRAKLNKKKKAKKANTVAVSSQSTSVAQLPWQHFVTVTTTPFMGKPMDFDGDDLIFNYSSMNEDITLLKNRQAIENEMASEGYQLDRPILQMSGGVEGQLFSATGFGTSANQGINLSTAALDLNAIASSWASAFMSMDVTGAPISSGNREPNTNVYVSRGFVNIGNLDVTPFYFTGGLIYVPYGRYANMMVSTPLTMSLARIRVPAMLLGFTLDNGLNGQLYAFTGNQTSGESNLFKQGGASLDYKHSFDSDYGFGIGTGWVSNVADAQGQQNTGVGAGTATFSGFGVSTATSTNNNLLMHNVNGMDVHGHLQLNDVTLLGEYVGSIERYATQDLTFNNSGAEPRAMHAELDYTLPFLPKKYGTTVAAAYGQTWDALALNLPENSYSAILSTSIWRETTEQLEYRHDVDYGVNTFATGRGQTPGTLITGTGKTRNSIIAQFGVYF